MENNVPHTRTYTQCLEILQQDLKEMSRKFGALKRWCDDHKLNYQKVVKMKNGSEKEYRPQFVQKILVALGYRVSLMRNYSIDNTEEDIYIVEKTDQDTISDGESAPPQ
ncbi:MAG: hypothetical protein LH615_02850 [Ferruginibacter sp.]|nr:hypothetical protein [Ferruginibacter sp.]